MRKQKCLLLVVLFVVVIVNSSCLGHGSYFICSSVSWA